MSNNVLPNPLPVSIADTIDVSVNDDFLFEVAKGNVANTSIFEKFGKNLDVDTGSVPQDAWEGGDNYTGFPSTAETMEIFSDSANDTSAGTGARTIEISNLQDGSGNSMPNVTVTLNGTTPVSLGAQTYSRCTRMKVMSAGSSGENAGEITLRHTSTTSNIFAVMQPAVNQTLIACYTVPLGCTLYINRLVIQMSRANGSAGSATVSFRARKPGETFQSKLYPEITHAGSFESSTYMVFSALTDLKVRVDDVSDNNTIVTADFSGIMVSA